MQRLLREDRARAIEQERARVAAATEDPEVVARRRQEREQAALEAQRAREQRVEQLRRLFRWVDADGGGSISVTELTAAIRWVRTRCKACPPPRRPFIHLCPCPVWYERRGGPPCEFKSNPGMVFTLFQKIDKDGSGDLGAPRRPRVHTHKATHASHRCLHTRF